MGIRPENIHDKEHSLKEYNDVLKVNVSVYELVGSEVYLYFEVGNANMIARVNQNTSAAVGSDVELYVDADAIHLFDKDTEKVIR